MKKISFLVITSFLLLSCGGSEVTEEVSRPNSIKITGEIKGVEGQAISLWVFEEGQERLIDSATVIDNTFEFWTETKELREYVLDIGRTHEVVYLFPDENAEFVEVTGSYPGITVNYEIKGDQNSKDYRDYWVFLQPFVQQQNMIMAELNGLGAEVDGASLEKRLDSLAAIERDYAIQYIEANPGSPVSWIMLQEFYPPSGLMNFDSADFKYFDMVSIAMKEKYPYSTYPEYIEESKLSTLAQIDQLKNGSGAGVAPELNYKSPDGKEIALSSLRGNVVLIDFWASWCGPCRMENPNVVKTYEKYKDKGFTVYSVSLDTDLNKWKQAIAADNLSWPNHVSDLKGWQSEAAAKYNVNSIPATFLLDKNGNIIEENLRGGLLEQKLHELLD